MNVLSVNPDSSDILHGAATLGVGSHKLSATNDSTNNASTTCSNNPPSSADASCTVNNLRHNDITSSAPVRPLTIPSPSALHLSPNAASSCLPPSSATTSSTPNRSTPQFNHNNSRGVSESSSTRDDHSTNGDDASSYSPFVDEEFLKHYNVKEIQNNVVNSLVDEEFLRHYRVDEIAANMGFNAPYTGNYGYDYFMGGECTLPPYDLLSHTLSGINIHDPKSQYAPFVSFR